VWREGSAHADLGFDFAFILAEHDEVGNLWWWWCYSREECVGREVRTFSLSDQAAPLAPVLLGVFCSVSDMMIVVDGDGAVADAIGRCLPLVLRRGLWKKKL
jgi:hypothetical protein